LQNLRVLWLSYTGITDAGLQFLIPLSNLRTLGSFYFAFGVQQNLISFSLALTNCKITDLGLRYLTLLPNLENLSLSYCYMITNAGIEALTSMPRTINLNLLGCNVIHKQLQSVQ
jgi:hypothetical protein